MSWKRILEGSSALSLFVEDEGNAASWIVGNGCVFITEVKNYIEKKTVSK